MEAVGLILGAVAIPALSYVAEPGIQSFLAVAPVGAGPRDWGYLGFEPPQ